MRPSDRAHAFDYAEMEREARLHRERFANSYRVLDAIGEKLRCILTLGDEYAHLELQSDAIFDLMDAGRDLPVDVADVLVAGMKEAHDDSGG